MNAPIPVSDALTLLSMALEDCDKATQGPWCWENSHDDSPWSGESVASLRTVAEFPTSVGPLPKFVMSGELDGDFPKQDAAFILLARATMRPMLECVRWSVRFVTNPNIGIESGHLYPPLAALRDHYTRTRPGWERD